MSATEKGPEPSLVLYQSEDGRTRIQCRFEGETLWLTQALIAELFATTPQNVTMHLKTIYAEGELPEEATSKPYLQVRREGARDTEDQARRKEPVHLADWQRKLDDFLRFNERSVLPDAGRVSREVADAKAHAEFERFADRRREIAEVRGEEEALKAIEELAKRARKPDGAKRNPKGTP